MHQVNENRIDYSYSDSESVLSINSNSEDQDFDTSELDTQDNYIIQPSSVVKTINQICSKLEEDSINKSYHNSLKRQVEYLASKCYARALAIEKNVNFSYNNTKRTHLEISDEDSFSYDEIKVELEKLSVLESDGKRLCADEFKSNKTNREDTAIVKFIKKQSMTRIGCH